MDFGFNSSSVKSRKSWLPSPLNLVSQTEYDIDIQFYVCGFDPKAYSSYISFSVCLLQRYAVGLPIKHISRIIANYSGTL